MVATSSILGDPVVQLATGLGEHDAVRVQAVHAFITPAYAERTVITGENALAFSEGVAATLASLETDADTRIAGLLFELPVLDPLLAEQIDALFGKDVADLVGGVRQLMRLHELTFGQQEVEQRGKNTAQHAAAQMEV